MNKLFLKPKSKYNANNNKKYKVEVIRNKAIYAKEIEKYILGLDYLVSQKKLCKKKKTFGNSLL